MSTNGPNKSKDSHIPNFIRVQQGSEEAGAAPPIAAPAPQQRTAPAAETVSPPPRKDLVRRPADEKAAVTTAMTEVPTEDELSAVLKDVLPSEEFKPDWIDKLPAPLIRLAGKERGAILSTFSRQRRGHSLLMGGDDAIEKAVELALGNSENGAAAFKGIRSLITAPTITPSSSPHTFKVLMSGASKLGIAHPDTLGEGAAMTLVQQMYKRKIADTALLADMLANLGEVGARNEGAAKVAWPALKHHYQDGKIKGEGIPKFLGSSGAMADKWDSVRPAILPVLKQEAFKFATAADKGYLQAAFEAVKTGLNHDPRAGMEFCFEVQNATQGRADFPKDVLEDTAVHFARPLVDAQNLMKIFTRESFRPADHPSEAHAIRGLLERVDASGLLKNRSRMPLVQAFDDVWMAHAFNEQSLADIGDTDLETDRAIRAIDQEQDTAVSIATAVIQGAIRARDAANTKADSDRYDVLEWRDLRIMRLKTEVQDRIDATIEAQDDLFQPNI